MHLSTTTNKRGRPFQRKTINAYVNAGKALSAWIGASQHVNAAGVEVTSFADVDVSTANAFFRWWYQTKDVPKSQDGKGLNIRIQDLDLQGAVLVVVPLMMDRNSVDGRVIPLQPSTVKALQRYLRLRTTHKRHGEPWLWLGLNNRPRLGYSGLWNMTKRRAEQAGYDSADVAPHCWCHSWADDLKARGVSGEHIMAIRGWKSPAMLRRYGADMASQGAVNTMHNLGDRYA